MGDIRTPRQAKGPGALKILKRTTQSVFMSKLPPRSTRNLHHSHALRSSRQVRRIDRQPWETRVAEILHVVEEHRYGRANALHGAIERANRALVAVAKKKAEVETFAEEMQAANEEMRAANEEMRANAEEMRAANEELRAVSEEMERIHTDQERFVPLAREELLGPLSSIRQYALSAADGLDDRGREHMAYIARHGHRMERILKNMLSYWRVDLEGRTLVATECETLFLRVLDDLQAEIQTRRTAVTHDPLPEALVDPDQFIQLMTVLLTNAIRFGPEQNAAIHVSAEAVGSSEVKIPDSAVKMGWVFSVRDNGPGVAAEDVERIFQIFETADGRREGVGMGLAIAWRIVKRHGGHIWVESTPGRGSTFYFTIPEYELPGGEGES